PCRNRAGSRAQWRGGREQPRAFAWGRVAAHDARQLEVLVRPLIPAEQEVARELDALVEHRAAFLADYQNAAYARRYRDMVAQIAATEAARTSGRAGPQEAVASRLFTL